ncbi:hypothetical protein DFH06DRAFT_1118091 [Mycena polygramma]|nr:hypothetical protein DFH06DRAFT_1118091 [Mycena polygramma]
MRFQTITFSLCAAIACVSAFPASNPIPASAPTPSTTNADRLKAGLPPLKPTKRQLAFVSGSKPSQKVAKRVPDAVPTSAFIEMRFISNAERLKRGLPLLKPTKRQDRPDDLSLNIRIKRVPF